EADTARPDQGPDSNQGAPGRYQQREKRQRFPECQQEHDRGGPRLMVANKIDDRPHHFFHYTRPFTTCPSPGNQNPNSSDESNDPDDLWGFHGLLAVARRARP